MARTPLPQRAIRAVGGSRLAGRLAGVQHAVHGPVVERVRRGPLHTGVLGHSVHPPLTDVTAGSWLGASVLDVAGGAESRRGATLLAGVGVLASVPTALAGAADWWRMSGGDSRIGAVHGLGMDAAILLLTGSLVARLRGAHRTGVGVALAGNVVVAGAGLLVGHLALHRGAARRGRPSVSGSGPRPWR